MVPYMGLTCVSGQGPYVTQLQPVDVEMSWYIAVTGALDGDASAGVGADFEWTGAAPIDGALIGTAHLLRDQVTVDGHVDD